MTRCTAYLFSTCLHPELCLDGCAGEALGVVAPTTHEEPDLSRKMLPVAPQNPAQPATAVSGRDGAEMEREASGMSSGPSPRGLAFGPDGVPIDWPDCPMCGAMRFYPSGRCMQMCDAGPRKPAHAVKEFSAPKRPDMSAAGPQDALRPEDEFYGGIWWVRSVGGLRSASFGECAIEIKRLQAIADAARGWKLARSAVLGQSVVKPEQYDRLARAEAELSRAVPLSGGLE